MIRALMSSLSSSSGNEYTCIVASGKTGSTLCRCQQKFMCDEQEHQITRSDFYVHFEHVRAAREARRTATKPWHISIHDGMRRVHRWKTRGHMRSFKWISHCGKHKDMESYLQPASIWKCSASYDPQNVLTVIIHNPQPVSAQECLESCGNVWSRFIPTSAGQARAMSVSV
jgi:hypothetical protein